jgi:hypothetical protein
MNFIHNITLDLVKYTAMKYQYILTKTRVKIEKNIPSISHCLTTAELFRNLPSVSQLLTHVASSVSQLRM